MKRPPLENKIGESSVPGKPVARGALSWATRLSYLVLCKLLESGQAIFWNWGCYYVKWLWAFIMSTVPGLLERRTEGTSGLRVASLRLQLPYRNTCSSFILCWVCTEHCLYRRWQTLWKGGWVEWKWEKLSVFLVCSSKKEMQNPLEKVWWKQGLGC